MLWSLVKILAFVVAITVATYGATLLLDMEGSATFDVGGKAATLSVIELFIAAIVLVGLLWLAFKLIGLTVATFKFLNGDETAISRYFSRNRERKGYEALSEGMMALASGEGRLAMAKANRAEKYLGRPELTNLLTAQAAELAGDRKTAEADSETALALAEKAFAIKPKHVETQDTLLKLQADKADWAGARKTLTAKLKMGQLPRDVHKRRDAVLSLCEAKVLTAEGKVSEGQQAAIDANRLSPDLVPAAIMAGRSYIAQGNGRAAGKVIKKAWETTPHPELAAVFAEIAPDETAEARLKRFRMLTKLKPEDSETKMLLAELHIANEDFPEARRVISGLVEDAPTVRTLTIMAAVERGEGAADSIVRGWLTKALTAPRGKQWICENCQHILAEWTPVCDNCGAFDTLVWKDAPNSEVTMPKGTEMLPLIVGQIEGPSEDDVADVVEAEVVETEDAK